ncbi:MAG: hypothetical protein Tsb0015_06290 [Simkaniaceae bacterium]
MSSIFYEPRTPKAERFLKLLTDPQIDFHDPDQALDKIVAGLGNTFKSQLSSENLKKLTNISKLNLKHGGRISSDLNEVIRVDAYIRKKILKSKQAKRFDLGPSLSISIEHFFNVEKNPNLKALKGYDKKLLIKAQDNLKELRDHFEKKGKSQLALERMDEAINALGEVIKEQNTEQFLVIQALELSKSAIRTMDQHDNFVGSDEFEKVKENLEDLFHALEKRHQNNKIILDEIKNFRSFLQTLEKNVISSTINSVKTSRHYAYGLGQRNPKLLERAKSEISLAKINGKAETEEKKAMDDIDVPTQHLDLEVEKVKDQLSHSKNSEN